MPDIEYSLDVGIPGKAGFAKEWDLIHPASSNLWVELDLALSLGCALDRGEASIPYMYARLPQSRDVFATTMPGRPRVNLRAGPNTDSAVVALLDWDILTVIDEKDSAQFPVVYKAALESCYSCHKSVGRPYLRPQIPKTVPQTIVNLDPAATWPQ